ncbi:HAMP domain-containing protein [bacterium]|nr:HAMP domain-containing protein [bacterium]
MKKTKASLLKKTLIVTIFTILVLGTIATLFVYYYSQNVFLDKAKEDIKNEVNEQADRIEKRLVFADSVLKNISSQDFVIATLSNNVPLSESVELKRYLNDDYYSAIYLLNKDGLTLSSTDQRLVGVNYGFREYFTEAIKGVNYFDVSIGVTTNELGYYLSAPVYKDNVVVGVAVNKLKPNYISEIISVEIDEQNYYLADKFGVTIGSSKKDVLYKTLGVISTEEKLYLEASKRYGNNTVSSLGYTDIQNGLKGISTEKIFEIYDESDKERELVAVDNIFNGRLFFVIEKEEEEIIEAATRVSYVLASFVGLTMLLASLLIFINVKRLLKPLKEIIIASSEIEKGNYDIDISYDSSDELGTLSKSIRSMAGSIKDYNQNLENKINEKTYKLERINKMMIGRELKMIELKNKIKERKR